MRFKEYYLTETTRAEDVTKKKGKKEVIMVSGRFQPWTAGHSKLVNISKKATGLPSLVFLVRGKHMVKDTQKNPLKFQEQKAWIKKSAGNDVIDVLEIKGAFITDFVELARKNGYEPKYSYVGSDRVTLAKTQIDKYGDIMDADIKVKEIKRTDKDISATQVRNAAKDNDFKAFKKITTGVGKKEFDLLRQRLVK